MSSLVVRCTKTHCELLTQIAKQATCYSTKSVGPQNTEKPKVSARLTEFQKKMREKTPIGKLDEIVGKHPHQEKEPLKPWPNNTNPYTGEVGGPAGPEPTRYGDWERKGRVSDF
ncbi:succinate dehydrogenase assembly factor 4, mitochondrial [Eupeodes corollae]|uniref:succinate dehydrogenase assembly factor 4, mitochondrial n=1 Tax=Eupeodes corollae TaxID=290404 RepID=UPI002490F128|nr:succinate dehydrogenase assembly factor 4, mitochondrial [Eupeodes corollae]